MGGVLDGYVAGYRGTAESLLGRIAELQSRDYPTELSSKLLGILSRVIQASVRKVDELCLEDVEDVEVLVVRHNHLLGYVHSLVTLISNSVGADVPRWAIQPMKQEVARFVVTQRTTDILVVGSDAGGNFAYDYRLDYLKRILGAALDSDTAAQLTEDLPENMAVFHFPFAERDNVLAHGAFFHEVGHQIDISILSLSSSIVGEFLTTRHDEIQASIWKQFEPMLKLRYGKLVGSPYAGDQPSFEDQEADLMVDGAIARVRDALHHWAREFCADLLATRILGPGYAMIIALSPTLLGELRSHAPSHPATLVRLRLVLSLLGNDQAGNFFHEAEDAMKEAGIWDLLSAWRDRCAADDDKAFGWSNADALTPGPVIAAYGDEVGERILGAIVDLTHQLPYYTPDRYNEDIRDLLPVLRSFIPINERVDYQARIHRANDLPTIFNVGMACYLLQETPDDRARVRRLLQKSIELSDVQRVLEN